MIGKKFSNGWKTPAAMATVSKMETLRAGSFGKASFGRMRSISEHMALACGGAGGFPPDAEDVLKCDPIVGSTVRKNRTVRQKGLFDFPLFPKSCPQILHDFPLDRNYRSVILSWP